MGAAYPFDLRELTRDDNGIWKFDRPASTIPDLLSHGAATAPDRPAVIGDDGRSLTYAQLWTAVQSVAGGLHESGLADGDRVALNLPNGIDWVTAYFGILTAGGVVVPINTRLVASEIAQIASDSGALRTLTVDQGLPSGDPYQSSSLSTLSLATLCYTSGTTGHPKGVMMTHANITSGIELFVRALEANDAAYEGPKTLIAVPLFHSAGLLTQLLTTMRLTGTCVVMAKFEAAAALELVEKHRVESMLGAPAILRALLECPSFELTDTSSLQSILYGAAPVSPDLVRTLGRKFPHTKLGNGYGMTETGNISFLPHRDTAQHPDSIGFASPATDIKLDSIDTDGVGELLVRGPQVMVGYWNMPGVTAETFVDGYLRTGDMCRMDSDGRLYLVDRAKDLIIRGGENVYSLEVENVLVMAEGVREVAVIGLPDEDMGERVAAVVVTEPGSAVDAEALLDCAAENLALYKLPEFVVIRDSPLPRNAGGKVIKRDLKDLEDWKLAPKLRATCRARGRKST